ncbi:MAG: sterol homeostasis protein [Alyxoria varia]|nr:MAG: sterol homeostasis protein [Alyxoria varia]
MPICIECRFPVHQLYTTYSKADDRALGKGVRLTQCPRCKRFADKYVEHDFVVLFIDLVLIKPQVYRHLLFNRLGREDDRFDPSIIRLGILLLLFDVYLTWARIEKAYPEQAFASSLGPIRGSAHTAGGAHETSPATSSLLSQQSSTASVASATSSDSYTNATVASALATNGTNFLSTQPILLQYIFFLILCALSTLAFHLPIRFLSSSPRSHDILSRLGPRSLLEHIPLPLNPPYPHPNRVSTALLVSSCTKLFPILMVVWDYDLPSSASAVSWAVIVNNLAALEILLDCGYMRAGALTGIGAGCRAFAGWALLRAAGLDTRKMVGGDMGVGGWRGLFGWV